MIDQQDRRISSANEKRLPAGLWVEWANDPTTGVTRRTGAILVDNEGIETPVPIPIVEIDEAS